MIPGDDPDDNSDSSEDETDHASENTPLLGNSSGRQPNRRSTFDNSGKKGLTLKQKAMFEYYMKKLIFKLSVIYCGQI